MVISRSLTQYSRREKTKTMVVVPGVYPFNLFYFSFLYFGIDVPTFLCYRGNTMVSPRQYHGITMVTPWYYHGITTVKPW